MRKFVYINEDGIIIAMNESANEVIGTNIIEVPLNFNMMNKRWNGTEWVEYKTETIKEIPITEQEQIAIDTALNVEYMACLMEASLT